MIPVHIPGYLTIGQLAALSKLTPAGVRYHCREGKLAGKVYYTGRDWLIPDETAQAFIDGLRLQRMEPAQ